MLNPVTSPADFFIFAVDYKESGSTSNTKQPMPVRLERLIELIDDAQRWKEGKYDYLPQLACSKCEKPCMPLCGLGLNRKVTPLDYKDVNLVSRKMMIETGKRGFPAIIQVLFVLVVLNAVV
jgi:hypothetical protein